MGALLTFSIVFTILGILIAAATTYVQLKSLLLHASPRPRLIKLIAACSTCVFVTISLTIPSTLVSLPEWDVRTSEGQWAVAAYVVDMIFYFVSAFLYCIILLDRFNLFRFMLRYPSWLTPLLFNLAAFLFTVGFAANITNIFYEKEKWAVALSILSVSGFVQVAVMDIIMGPIMVNKVLKNLKDMEELGVRRAERTVTGSSVTRVSGSGSKLYSPTSTSFQPRHSVMTIVEEGRPRVNETPRIDARWRFILLFTVSMTLDVLAFAMFGFRFLLPENKVEVKMLMATLASLHVTAGFYFLKELKTTVVR
ncbi:hypothetical protein HK104_004415 [Borealophlyctis nickersoniae]|nr:hypothetical protein HK104_004415 [Borealophlyctis nickersoniae]